jgi:hypothetical protein
VKRLKELETVTLDKLILAEAAKGNFFPIRGE